MTIVVVENLKYTSYFMKNALASIHNNLRSKAFLKFY